MPKAKLKINELISLVEISRHSNVDSVMWLLIIVLYRFTMKKRKPGKRNKKIIYFAEKSRLNVRFKTYTIRDKEVKATCDLH